MHSLIEKIRQEIKYNPEKTEKFYIKISDMCEKTVRENSLNIPLQKLFVKMCQEEGLTEEEITTLNEKVYDILDNRGVYDEKKI